MGKRCITPTTTKAVFYPRRCLETSSLLKASPLNDPIKNCLVRAFLFSCEEMAAVMSFPHCFGMPLGSHAGKISEKEKNYWIIFFGAGGLLEQHRLHCQRPIQRLCYSGWLTSREFFWSTALHVKAAKICRGWSDSYRDWGLLLTTSGKYRLRWKDNLQHTTPPETEDFSSQTPWERGISSSTENWPFQPLWLKNDIIISNLRGGWCAI